MLLSAKSKTEIVVSVIMKFPPKEFPDCYVGVISDNDPRLFENHNTIPKENFLYEKAVSVDVARELKKKFIDLGMKGTPGEGGENSTVVYVYKTNPAKKS